MSKLKIGDNLYRYTGVSIMEYVVYGVVERDVGTLYELRCLSCRDHSDCELLVAESKQNFGFRFIDMISSEDQSYWHSDTDPYQRFERTKNDAVIMQNESHIKLLKDNIRKSKDSISANELAIKKAEGIIEALRTDVEANQ